MFKKNNPCPKCGSIEFVRRMITRWCEREYCAECGAWKRTFTERIDPRSAPSHCGKCKYFEETVFEGETANGWPSWDGYCTNQKSTTGRTKSRYYGCDFGELKPREEKK